MPIDFPLVSVNLATVCIESFLYGIFVVLFVASLYIHVYRSGLSQQKAASTSFPLGLSPHWICTFIRLFQAFITYNGGKTPLLFYADLSQLTEIVKTGFLVASIILGDAMIIYRLWVVWNYNKYVIIFPICTLLGLTVCGIGITYQFTQYTPGEDVFRTDAGRWVTSDFLIAWRIYSVDKASKKVGAQNLTSVLAIVVESAAIYTSWTIFFFATYQSKSNLQFTAADGWSAMSGIAFMLINVRVGLGWARRATENSTSGGAYSTSAIAIASPVEQGRAIGSGNRRESYSYLMRPVTVNITTVVDTDKDYDSDHGPSKCSSDRV
ncbi:hypothetical protein BDQ17DRAFT_1392511 [Cyathus striatus]|nr:hypothetical protein BDQ17DRAFT_1392511 [Cyathus striatus]